MRGFAWRVARRYARPGVPADDLAAAGLVGVLRAAEGFDQARARQRDWLVYDPAAPAGEVWLAVGPAPDLRRAWLAYSRSSCAREVAREARRQAGRLLPTDAGLAGAAAPHQDPDDAAEAAADRQAVTDRVRAAIEGLPERQRRLVEAVHGLAGPPVTLEAARKPLRLNRRRALAELAAGREALRVELGAWFG